MAKILVTAHPYAVQFGHIEVPDNETNPEKYIEDNWDNIKFDEPNLDYRKTDFEYEAE